MKSGRNQPGRLKTTAIRVAAGAVFCCLASTILAADAPAPLLQQSPATNSLSVALEFQEVPFTVMTVGLSHTDQAIPFGKEPATDQNGFRRGQLRFQSAPPASMAFLWNVAQGKLFLDLNRNDDLTDDPDGMFQARSVASSDSTFRHATFPDIRLKLPAEPGTVRCLVDLNFSEYRKRLNVSASVRSFWSGKAVLEGHEWQIGVVSHPGIPLGDRDRNHLLARSWDLRDRPFTAQSGSLAAFPMPVELFVGTRAYEIDASHGTASPRLTLTQKPAELGEVRQAGEFVQRILLTEGLPSRPQPRSSRVVLLDGPQGAVQVPVGMYHSVQVQIGNAEATASLQGSTQRLLVSKDNPAALTAGGPLTNNIVFTQRGSSLVLSYRLLGADGLPYSMANPDYQNPPQFAIYQGDKKIASGKFEFG